MDSNLVGQATDSRRVGAGEAEWLPLLRLVRCLPRFHRDVPRHRLPRVRLGLLLVCLRLPLRLLRLISQVL